MRALKEFKYLIIDLDRWAYALGLPIICIPLVLFIYVQTWSIFSYRLARAVHLIKWRWLRWLLYLPAFILRKVSEVITSNTISEKAKVGPGFYIGHTGAIVVGSGTVAGVNFSIRQSVTLGGGSEYGSAHPTIGNNVVLGAGAVVIGGVNVGSNVLIGANAVVTKDIQDCARAVGAPAEVINLKGSYGIVNRNFWHRDLLNYSNLRG